MKALDVPVHYLYGLRPAQVRGTPLTALRDTDKLAFLKNVPTLNFRPHLPQYEITEKNPVHLLARQPIDLDRPHPFTAAGNTELCRRMRSTLEPSCLWTCTNFTTLFGGTDSLQKFWRYLASMD
jgi:hypothetical protein